MKINVPLFLDHINKARVGGLINEAVFGNHLSFALADESQSVVSICLPGIVEEESDEIGIFSLDVFCKFIQDARDRVFKGAQEIEMNVVEVNGQRSVLFKNGDNECSFILSNPKDVWAAVENSSQVLETIRKIDPTVVRLNKSSIGECL